MQETDMVDPVLLAKFLIVKGVITQNEYDKLVQDSQPNYNQGGASSIQ